MSHFLLMAPPELITYCLVNGHSLLLTFAYALIPMAQSHEDLYSLA